MARIAVPYDDYVDGRMPEICMISGRPTSDVFVLRVEVPANERPQATGTVLGSLDRLITAIDTRKPRRILLGKVPVDRRVWHRIRFRQRLWTAALVLAVLGLVAAAWAAAPWSPVTAVAATALGVVAFARRRSWRTTLPRPHLTHGGMRVTLDGVHAAFAAAITHDDL